MDFEWMTPDEDEKQDALGSSYGNLIKLSPTRPLGGLSMANEMRGTERFGTLLHELIHVFLHVFACQKCPISDDNVANAGWHGRAFQRLASHFKRISKRRLGVQLDISGGEQTYFRYLSWSSCRACTTCLSGSG